MAKRDANEDGSISEEERFVASAPEEQTGGRGRVRGRFEFTRLDIDEDGILSTSEIVQDAVAKCEPRAKAIGICLEFFGPKTIAKTLELETLAKHLNVEPTSLASVGFKEKKSVERKESYPVVYAAVQSANQSR